MRVIQGKCLCNLYSAGYKGTTPKIRRSLETGVWLGKRRYRDDAMMKAAPAGEVGHVVTTVGAKTDQQCPKTKTKVREGVG